MSVRSGDKGDKCVFTQHSGAVFADPKADEPEEAHWFNIWERCRDLYDWPKSPQEVVDGMSGERNSSCLNANHVALSVGLSEFA